MNRRRGRRAALLTCALLLLLVGGVGLWVRAQQRQYALNRALIAALVKGDNRQALALVNEGADPNTRYKPTPTPALVVLAKQLFHRSPPPLNDSPTAFAIACGVPWNDDYASLHTQRSRLEDGHLVQAMRIHGAKPNIATANRTIPLFWAAYENRLKTTRLLLEYGANVNAKDGQGRTPLMYAVLFQEQAAPDLVRLLLEHGADANAKNYYGTTPLMIAVRMHNDPAPMLLLLEHGANANAQNRHGATALHQAVMLGEDTSFIRQLMAHGANPNLADDGVTPLMLARSQKRPDLVVLLRQYGARK